MVKLKISSYSNDEIKKQLIFSTSFNLFSIKILQID